MDVDPGRTVYTCMLNREAGIEADLTVSILEEDGGSGAGALAPSTTSSGRRFYIAAAGGAAYQNWAHIQQTIQVPQFLTVQQFTTVILQPLIS
jgi:sarcosine dehydrogenase